MIEIFSDSINKEDIIRIDSESTLLIHPSEVKYIRVTSLKTFELCPYTWATKYLVSGIQQEERTGPAAIGTAVHAICEDFLMQLHGGAEAKDMSKNWNIVPINEHSNVHTYLQSLAEIDGRVLAVEERYFFKMREDAPPISGQMDFVCETPDGYLLIVDHKTNRSYNKADWWKVQLQQLCYAWMARQEYPGMKGYIFRIGYPNLGTHVQWMTNPEDDGPLMKRFDRIWESMLSYAEKKDWPQSVNDECGWCAIQDTCEERKMAITKFSESFKMRTADKPIAEQLKWVKSVGKIIEALQSELEKKLIMEIELAGGKLTSAGAIWTAEYETRRKASYVETLQALVDFTGTYPQHVAILNECIPDLFNVSVGVLDKIAKSAREFKPIVEQLAIKTPNAKKTIRSTAFEENNNIVEA